VVRVARSMPTMILDDDSLLSCLMRIGANYCLVSWVLSVREACKDKLLDAATK
jgi:hypothetical protein